MFVLKPLGGDDLNIGVFGGEASRQKFFFFFFLELRICSTALGKDDPSTGHHENAASLSDDLRATVLELLYVPCERA
jgi:hypothetical protein